MPNKKYPDVLWVAQVVETSRPLMVGDERVSLDITWADGMVGVLPVFESKEAARRYAKHCGTDVAAFDVVKINIGGGGYGVD